jgi:hypothetical protein
MTQPDIVRPLSTVNPGFHEHHQIKLHYSVVLQIMALRSELLWDIT